MRKMSLLPSANGKRCFNLYRNAAWDEYVVVPCVRNQDGKLKREHPDTWYHTSDKEDALDTRVAMLAEYESRKEA